MNKNMEYSKLYNIIILLYNIFGYTIKNLSDELNVSERKIKKILKDIKIIRKKPWTL